MKPRNLFNSDDRAVSPVIGVILMVAITVILAAVIGTFVLGLGDSLGDSQPTAQIDTDLEFDGSGNYTLSIEHAGGDRIDSGALNVIVGDGTNQTEVTGVFSDAFTVGDTESADFVSDGGGTADIRVRIVHQPSDSIIVDKTVEVDDGGVDSGTSLTIN
jgi:flagellin-like protein